MVNTLIGQHLIPETVLIAILDAKLVWGLLRKNVLLVILDMFMELNIIIALLVVNCGLLELSMPMKNMNVLINVETESSFQVNVMMETCSQVMVVVQIALWNTALNA